MESVLCQQRHHVRGAAREHGADRVDRVRGVRHERDVAGVDEAEGHVADALLCPDERHDLLVAELDVEAAGVPAGDGVAHLRQAVGLGIAVVGRVVGGCLQRGEDVVGRRNVGVADAEADDVDALGALLRDLPADLEEEVRRKLVEPVGELHTEETSG